MLKTPNTQFFKTPNLDGLAALQASLYHQSFSRHSHETYQVTLTTQGVFKNQIGNQVIQAVENQISITHPQEVHATLCDEQSGHSFFTLYIPPTLVAAKFKNKVRAPARFNSLIQDNFLVDIIRKTQQSITSNGVWFESMIWSVIDRLIDYHQTSPQPLEKQPILIDLSQLDTDTTFSLDCWAEQFNLARFKFLRQFKSQTGMTPNQYLIFERIKQGQSLLIDGADLTETALECGFYDLPHFHKHFKKITGITPMMFQQAHINPVI